MPTNPYAPGSPEFPLWEKQVGTGSAPIKTPTQPVITDPADIGTQVMLQQKAAKAAGLPTANIDSSSVDPNLTQDAFTGNVQMELNRMLGGSPGIVSSEDARQQGSELDTRMGGMPGSLVPQSAPTDTSGANTTNNAQGQTGAPTGPDIENDPLLKLLTKMQTDYDRRLKEEEASLAAERDQRTITAKLANANAEGASTLSLLRSGGFSAQSGQQYLQSVVNDGRAKLAQIDKQYLDAMRKAKDARADIDYKIANQMIDRAEKLQKDFVEEKQRQIDNLLKFEQIEKLRRESFESTIKSWSEANLDPASFPEGYLDSMDASMGFPAGVSASLLDAANITNQIKNEKDVAEATLKILEARNKLPKGQSFFIGDTEYTGLYEQKPEMYIDLEVDGDGIGTLVTMDKNIGPSSVRAVNLGRVGKATDGWINAYDAQGNAYRFNTRTQETKPIEIKGDWVNPSNFDGFDSWLSSMGNGKVTTQFGGKTDFEDAHPGFDIDGNLGDKVLPFFPPDVTSMRVVSTIVNQTTGGSKGYGNQVVLEDNQGRKWMYNHLQEGTGVAVTPGQTITKDTIIGYMGNTGSVMKGEGDGSHLDVRVIRPSKPLSPVAPKAGDMAPSIDTSKLTPQAQETLQYGKNFISQLNGKYKQEAAMDTLTGYLNKGDVQGADNYLRTTAVNTMSQSERDDYKMYDQSVEAAKQAVDFINQKTAALQKGQKVGPYKALIEGKKTYANIDKDKDYAQLKQWITLGDAQIRRGFFGVAVTDTEAGTATGFLFDPTDDLATVTRKIKGNIAFFSFVNDLSIAEKLGKPRPVLDDYLVREGLKSAPASDWKAGFAPAPAGQILIKRNGQPGYIPESEFNPSTDVR